MRDDYDLEELIEMQCPDLHEFYRQLDERTGEDDKIDEDDRAYSSSRIDRATDHRLGVDR